MAEFTMVQALNRALRDSLADDDRMLLFGEDIGKLGGVFRVTDGLQAQFGEERVFDTPLAESGIAGVAVGLAIAVRLWLLHQSGWLLEGDDALSALMALDVLDGDRPLMLKNQTYAAAWEPYAMAASYALFGLSRISAIRRRRTRQAR